MVLDLVIENLEAESLLQNAPRTHLALAYSGGADSTALLFLLNEIKARYPLDVTAIYFNHGWRDTPPAELPLVHRNCLKCKVPLVIVQADKRLAKTESVARQARYRQLTAVAQDLRANALLTAHHADDQIETLLFRVLRGTGLDGLGGIHRRLVLDGDHGSPVPILRPLIDIARKRLKEYVETNTLEFFHDPTNDDVKIQRNNIRHNLLPALEASFPQVKNALFRLSLVAEGDLRIIDDAVEGIWERLYREDATGPSLEALAFTQLGDAYQRRILKRFLSRQGIHSDFEGLEDLLLFVRGEGRRNLDASLKSLIKDDRGKTRFLALYKGYLRVIEAAETAPAVVCVPVTLPGHVQVPELSRTFTASIWREPAKVQMSPIRPHDSQQVYVDLSAYLEKEPGTENLAKPLELRTRRPGDKFQPMGLDVPLRLKKFLINRGVPRFDRDRLLVLACGNMVLWVPGLGINQALRVPKKGVPTHLLQLQTGLHPEPQNLWDPPPLLVEMPEPIIPEDVFSDVLPGLAAGSEFV